MTQPWFSVRPLGSDTWAISEPEHSEQPHCYLLLGQKQARLIDTGLGAAPLRPVVRSLTDLPVLAAVTHAHWDHMGGLREFDRTAAHTEEVSWLSGVFPLPPAAVKAQLLREPCRFPDSFDPDGYTIYDQGVTCPLTDGQVIDLGGRLVTVLHTPGHPPGHLCYWEEPRGILYSGDLLYRGTLDLYYPTTDPAAFLDSVRRIAALPVRALRPGHYDAEVPPELTGQVLAALEELVQAGRLAHGQGILDYGSFRLHL